MTRPACASRRRARSRFSRDAQHTIDLAIEADDDIGLASLRLRYTKVSGSGERFTFTEGELPIDVTRATIREHGPRARTWKLEPLALDAGDMVVYRAVATDHRPGAPPPESDSFIAEMLAPGGQAAPGFAIDPEQERYAVSQQMVISRPSGWRRARRRCPPEAYATEAQEHRRRAAKGARRVRVHDGRRARRRARPDADITELNEEAEAAGEDDLLAGRTANQGRVALLRAIRSMSRAATSLTTADLTAALTHERAALDAARARVLAHAHHPARAHASASGSTCRAGSPACSPTPARDVASARRRRRPTRASSRCVARSPASPRSPARRSLGATTSARASTLAESVLRVDPSDDDAAATSRASLDVGGGGDAARSRADDAHDLLDRAATGARRRTPHRSARRAADRRQSLDSAPRRRARPTRCATREAVAMTRRPRPSALCARSRSPSRSRR